MIDTFSAIDFVPIEGGILYSFLTGNVWCDIDTLVPEYVVLVTTTIVLMFDMQCSLSYLIFQRFA